MSQRIYNAQKLSLTLTALTTYKLFCKQNETRYSKTCVKRPFSQRWKFGFQNQLSLKAGQKYCRYSKGSILQYFRLSLSYHLSLRSLFCLFLSGRFTQVLLYMYIQYSTHCRSRLYGINKINSFPHNYSA